VNALYGERTRRLLTRSAPLAYSRQHYRRVLEIMDDADQLPCIFDQWLKHAGLPSAKSNVPAMSLFTP
jgi:hypothetical protein